MIGCLEDASRRLARVRFRIRSDRGGPCPCPGVSFSGPVRSSPGAATPGRERAVQTYLVCQLLGRHTDIPQPDSKLRGLVPGAPGRRHIRQNPTGSGRMTVLTRGRSHPSFRSSAAWEAVCRHLLAGSRAGLGCKHPPNTQPSLARLGSESIPLLTKRLCRRMRR